MKHLILPLLTVWVFWTSSLAGAATVYVVGHRTPDTDSVASAIAAADVLRRWKGLEAVAAIQGPLSRESAHALKKFGLPMPVLFEDANGKHVVCVDHSDREQAPKNIENATIVGIFDHHKLGGLRTTAPPEIWIRPVGSTCTVIKGLYDFTGLSVPPDIAAMMLCAILSDTATFRSPTTVEADKQAAQNLAATAQIADVAALGAELLRIKSSVADISARDLLLQDFKDFQMSGVTVGIGQVELQDKNALDDRKAALLEECRILKREGRHTVLFLATDVTWAESELFVASDDESIVENAFGVKLSQGTARLPGIVSRKLQVVPPLENAFAQRR